MRRTVVFAIAVLASARASGAQVAPPTVRSIQVGRDTIRFFERFEQYESDELPVVGYVRATHQWVQIHGNSRRSPRLRPWELRDAIAVAPHLRLVGVPTPGRRPPGFSHYALVSDDGGRYAVEGNVSSREAWAVASHDPWMMYDFSVARPRVASSITRWARGGGALWFATYGSGDELGALLRFDPALHHFDVVLDTLFDNLDARAMAATTNAVWLAGTRYGSTEPDVGLYEWDASRRVATRLTAAMSSLPGDTVLALAAAGDTLWISTTEGLALMDARSGQWDVRWFHATASIDTVEVSGAGYTNEEGNREFSRDSVGVVDVSFDLTAQRPAGEDGRRLAYALVDELRPRSDRTFTPDSFFTLLARVPAAHFDSAAAGRRRIAHALAHPEIVRRLVALDSANEEGFGLGTDAIAAIGLLGDRTYLPILQAIPAEDYGDQDFLADLTLALARLGDRSRVPALRDRVGHGSLGFNDLRYAEALHATGDSAVLPALLAYVDSTRYVSAFNAVRLFASRDQWRAIVGRFVRDPGMRDDLLEWTAHYDRADTLTDPVVRAALARGTRLTLEAPAPRDSAGRPDHGPHARAASVAVTLRDPGVLPALVPLLGGDETDWEIAMRALIELTGVDNVPAPPRPSDADRAASRKFWEGWWRANGARRDLVVSIAAGEEAMRRWRLRWELATAR